MKITGQQIKDLWHNGGRIDRGDDYSPVTEEDLQLLMCGDVDTDDQGVPLEPMWEVLADQLNGEEPGEPTGPRQEELLEDIADAVRSVHYYEEERDALIRSAVADRVPVTAIAEKAGLSRARIYQIRDGRR